MFDAVVLFNSNTTFFNIFEKLNFEILNKIWRNAIISLFFFSTISKLFI